MERKDILEKRAERIKAKAITFSAMAGICVCMLSGCQDTVQTEEELVTPREQTEAQNAAPGQPEGSAAAGNVTGQVQVPERYQWQAASDSTSPVSVTVDAAVVVPDVSGIKTKKVTGRAFTQEDYDMVSQALLGGSGLWNRTGGPTVSELEAKIAFLEEEKKNGVKGDEPYADKEETLDEQIAMYREAAETALDEPIIEDVPAIVEYDASLPEGQGNWLNGCATVNGRNYYVNLDNSLLTGEFRKAVFQVTDENCGGSWNFLMTDLAHEEAYYGLVNEELVQAFEKMQLQPEEARQEAEKALSQMGMEEFVPSGGEYCYIQASTEQGESFILQTGYSVHCTREIEGFPVTYVHESGIIQEGASMWWPAEELSFVYNDEGLVGFEWVNPCQIEELSSEPVFLMPFAEIQDIFQEMILKTSLDDFLEEGDSVEIQVEEVRLGYMRVQESDAQDMTGIMVPVWDFFGSKVTRNASGEVKYAVENEYESLLTINAMDGTIISR